ncbi:aspartyl-phosphate phosphatase Spo0E family protein [Paenibacillus sp. FSL R7-0345]|uniref:aspartyl-phosphate phosphatase Spo0E family protein n=1 Tax=Paenibacillus sp. FSL R7-0345 TaxID=2954535 RepID=UPI00315ACE8E
MNDLEGIKQSIEQARYKLNKLERQLELGHPAVLHQSMVLDELINEYNRYCFRRAMGALRSNTHAAEASWIEQPRQLSFS